MNTLPQVGDLTIPARVCVGWSKGFGRWKPMSHRYCCSIQQGDAPCAANRVSTWLHQALQHRAAMSFRICSQDSACYLLNLGRVQKWTFHSNSQQLQFLRLMDYVGNCPDIFLADPRISKRTNRAHLWEMATPISHESACSGQRKEIRFGSFRSSATSARSAPSLKNISSLISRSA